VSRQLGLFGGAYERRIDDHDALVALAARLPPHVRFGTSTWTFPEWRSLVYVETDVRGADFARSSLEEYARHPLFRTVGLDRTFYAPIGATELRAYAAQLPAGFRMVSKVWSDLTTPVFPRHARYGKRAGQPSEHFLDAKVFTDTVLAPFEEAFAAHEGPFVLEIPRAPMRVDPDAFAGALAAFLENVPPSHDYAIELREPKLLGAKYLETLARFGATHVFNLWTHMPTIGEQLAIPGTLREGTRVVVRLMVPRGKKYEALKKAWAPFDRIREIDERMRADVTTLVERAGAMGCEVYVIANNKAEGCAPLTVRALAERIARQ
jgi:uncharacterized protein YecE (DUF72 family)